MSYDHAYEDAVNTGGCTATFANQHGEFAASTHGVEQRRPKKMKNEMFLLLQLLLLQPTQHSKLLR